MDELVDVGALVYEDDDSQELVLDDGGLQSPIRPGVGYPATVVSLQLVVHGSAPGGLGAPHRGVVFEWGHTH